MTTPLQGVALLAYPYLPTSSWLAYAPWDRSFYVAVPPSSVDVLSDTNYSITAIIRVGSMPFGVAVDNATREVFVTNTASNNVTVISGSTQKVVGNVPVQRGPVGVTFDAANGDLYVADNLTNNVSVIAPSSLTVVTTIPVGPNPRGIAWDATTGTVFVADSGSNQVTVISGSSNVVLATVQVGVRPYGVAVDSKTDNVYVTNQGSNNVSVVSATKETLNATIRMVGGWSFDLQGVAYDSVHGLIWVGGGGPVIVIDPTSETVVDYMSTDPSGVVFDPDTGDMCFTNVPNVTIACFAFGGGVQFAESGLPLGTVWFVTLGSGTRSSSGAAIWFPVSSGRYPYWVGDVPGWHESSLAYAGNVTVGPTIVDEPALLFHPFLLNVSFQESGLRSGTPWSVNLSGTAESSSTSTIVFSGANGSYSYYIPEVSGYWVNPVSGGIRVSGTVVTQAIRFSEMPQTIFNVTFIESGLALGTSWSITLEGTSEDTTAPTLVFLEPNGVHKFSVGTVAGYLPVSLYGSVRVNGTATQTVVGFVPVPPCCQGIGPPSSTNTEWVLLANGAIGIGAAAAFAAVFALTRRHKRGS